MRDIDTTKAAVIDRFPEKCLKDGVDVLAKPVTDICNLSISSNRLPNSFKLANVKFIFKMVEIVMSQIVGNKAKRRISKWVFQEKKHAKFSEKRTFLTPWYAHVRTPPPPQVKKLRK